LKSQKYVRRNLCNVSNNVNPADKISCTLQKIGDFSPNHPQQLIKNGDR
jgi:hypothetical protein